MRGEVDASRESVSGRGLVEVTASIVCQSSRPLLSLCSVEAAVEDSCIGAKLPEADSADPMGDNGAVGVVVVVVDAVEVAIGGRSVVIVEGAGAE